MALLWIEGFEGFGTTGSFFGRTSQKYTCTREGATWVPVSGRVTGTALKWYDIFIRSVMQTPAGVLGNAGTLIVGWAWQRSSDKTAHSIMELWEGTNRNVNVRLKSNGEFEVYRDTTLLGTTSGADIGNNTWAYFEMKVVTDNTAGSVVLKINGTQVLSLTSQDTQTGSNAYSNFVQWCSNIASAGAGTDTYFDDIYICDNSGSTQNDFLGDSYIQGMLPDGAGSSTQFTPHTGSNYAQVNENPNDGDTSYVEDSTSSDKDSYSYADASPSISNTIFGVQINTTAKNGSGTFGLKADCKSGSTTSVGGSVTLTSSYVTSGRVVAQDPNTSTAWTPTTLNAAEFGYEVA